MTQYCIGFANMYYTLWSVNTRIEIEGRRKYNITSYTFIKNLSTIKSKAFEKAPEGAIYDKNLKGMCSSYEYKTRIKLDDDMFQFGKYEGVRFIDCEDYNYMSWYYSECGNDIQREYIKRILDFCPTLKFYNGKYYSLEGYNKIMESEAIFNNHSNKIDNKEEVIIDILYNITDSDGIYYDRSTGFRYQFPNVKENYYQGYFYYLPIDDKGKAKRIKGKKIVITDYEKIGEGMVKIIDWRIQK